MNALGIACVWCAVQVTLVTASAVIALALSRRYAPTAGRTIAMTAVAVVLTLSLLGGSPWPRWVWSSTSPEQPMPSSDTVAAAPVVEPLKSAEGPSVWLNFWEAFGQELAYAPAPTMQASSWKWTGVVGVVALVLAAVGAFHLLAGLIAVRTCRSRALPIRDPQMLELLDVVRAELGCATTIALRETSHLMTAATVGWWRPVVLLPIDWRTWTALERRTVLAHEVAHIKQADFLSCVCAQLGLALHFYHPLMHWLTGRLRLELELAADAAAAKISGGAGEYVQTLARMALREADRPVGWPARSFLPTQGTLLRRIDMLRGTHSFSARSPLAIKLAVVGALVGVAVVAVGLRGTAADEPVFRQVALFQGAGQVPPGAAPRQLEVTYVPEDAGAVVVLRPAELLGRKELAAIKQILEEQMGPQFGVPPDQIEQLTVVVLLPKPDERLSEPIVMFRMRTPEALKAMAAKQPSKAVQADDPNVETAEAIQVDDRTVIAGRPGQAARLLAGGARSRSPLVTSAAWKELSNGQAIVGVRAELVREILKQTPAGRIENGMLGTVSPLWEKSDDLIVKFAFGDTATLTGVFACPNAEAVGEVRETLQAFLTLMKNMSRDLRKRLPGGHPEAAIATTFLQLGEDLCTSAKIESKETTVRLTTGVDVDQNMVSLLTRSVRAARTAAGRSVTMNNLKQLGLALHNYAAIHDTFPPAVVIGPDGKTPHSWRIEVLPYVDQEALYRQYHMDEPWDSEHNKTLIAKMPAVFRDPADSRKEFSSGYFMLTGEAALGGTTKGRKFSEILDGTSNTIMLVEAKRDIPWTKPEDIPFDAEKELPLLGGFNPQGFSAMIGDGSVMFFDARTQPDLLKKMITYRGGEVIEFPGRFPEPTLKSNRAVPTPLPTDAPRKK